MANNIGCGFMESWANNPDLPIIGNNNGNYQLILKKEEIYHLLYCFVCGSASEKDNKLPNFIECEELSPSDAIPGSYKIAYSDEPYQEPSKCECGLVSEWAKDPDISVELRTISAEMVFRDSPKEKIPFETINYYVICAKKNDEPIYVNIGNNKKVPLIQSINYCPGCGDSLEDELQTSFAKLLIAEESLTENSDNG